MVQATFAECRVRLNQDAGIESLRHCECSVTPISIWKGRQRRKKRNSPSGPLPPLARKEYNSIVGVAGPRRPAVPRLELVPVHENSGSAIMGWLRAVL